METQVENAIQIAWNPAADNEIKTQAINFLNQLRAEPTAAWQICLALFTRTPRADEVVRHVALEIVNLAVQQLDAQNLALIKDNLWNHIRQTYGPGNGEAVDTAHIQNKLTQTTTYLFTVLYPSTWESFFDDFRALAGDAAEIGTTNPTTTLLYLRLLGSIHDEIADVLMSRSPEESKRNQELKDHIRGRDAQKISISWQEVLAKWRQTDLGIVEMCLKTISKWVSWIDISLVVNEALLNNLFEIAGQQGVLSSDVPEARVRDAAIDTFTETVAKKMKASDKVQLISFLNLGNVVGQLIASPSLADQSVSTYDNDLAEAVAKLVNTTLTDVVKILDTDSADDSTKAQANELLRVFVPYLLRFFSDEYDEICSTVIPSLTDLLTYFRKIVKTNGTLPQEYASMLHPILEAIIMKMKYDSTANVVDEDEQTDEAEFEELRKRLHVLQQQVAAIDETLYIETLSTKIAGILGSFDQPDSGMSWRDVELALHEMFLFGELAVRNGGMYAKREPSSLAAARLIEMMTKMVESNVAAFDNYPVIPSTYLEICNRYSSFFEQNTSLIPRVLENFVRLVHSSHRRLKLRSWYLFSRFVKPLRNHIGPLCQTIIQAIGDLLIIKAELPNEDDDDMSSDDNGQSYDATFNNQLYLFEAIGHMLSSPSVPIESKVVYIREVLNPLFSDLEQNLSPAKGGDERATTQVHHLIEAIGTLGRGLVDTMPGAHGPAPPPEISEEFVRASEAILMALESLNSSITIRTAARFAFSRLIGVLGPRVLQQLPRWIEGLLSPSSTKDEMATFLRLIEQVVFGFKSEVLNMLDTLLTPLLQRVFSGLAEPTNGTDDEIQLAELRREYLNFLLVILNNDLASVFISNANQATFDTIITTIEHFARDPTDYPTARLGVSVLVRMTAVWGGPDIPPNDPSAQPSPTLPGFEAFAMTRFSPLAWSIPTSAGFNIKDAQARGVLGELAALKLEILKKCGHFYLERLRGELLSMGVDEQGTNEYLHALSTKGEKGFKQYFQQFVSRAAGN
ncbi:Exportin-T [Phyllosticta citriasiana]|uniref:Exportin-T n=1 Tax=Phyllosticta citriasiana TaxID=595635 RepID=UPI0030FD683D